MRAALLIVVLAAPVAAQPVLFPEAAPPTAGPHWRVAPSVGLAGGGFATVLSLRADRTWRGPLSLGGRAWATLDHGFVDDGPSLSGGGGEALASVGTRDRWIDLRANAGLGLAVLDYASGGLGCEPEFEGCLDTGGSFSGVRPYLVGGIGLDLYLLPGVGLGADVRAALMEGPADISMAELGLRVRVAQ